MIPLTPLHITNDPSVGCTLDHMCVYIKDKEAAYIFAGLEFSSISYHDDGRYAPLDLEMIAYMQTRIRAHE